MTKISEAHTAWLEARGIRPDTAEALGLYSKGAWLMAPYVEHGRAVNCKARHTERKDHRMEPGKPLILFNHDVLLTGDERVILTEGEWDCIAAIQSGYRRTVSVPNGAPHEQTDNPWEAKRYEWVHRHEKELANVQCFVLATDSDEPGRLLAAELAGLLGPERCRFVTYPEGCKDLNDVLLYGGEEAVQDVLQSSKPYPVKGIYRFSDYPPRSAVSYIESRLEGIRGMWPLVPGTFSVITGFSGIGKSTLINWILGDYLEQGVRMSVGSFETDPYILQQSMRATLLKRPFDSPLCQQPNAEVDALLDERMTVMAQHCGDEESEMSLEYLLELARVAVIRDGAKLIVTDPWNEIEHMHAAGETENDYTGRAIRAIKRACRSLNVAWWMVAHPRKPENVEGALKAPGLYAISGSAHWSNKADYGITIHREDKSSPVTSFIVTKKRMGLPGREGRSLLALNEFTSGFDVELAPF